MLSKSINVGIVDDHTLFRKFLKNYISENRIINVVLQSPDVPDLLKKLTEFNIDILLMDIFMPKINGGEAVKLIRNEYPHIKILVLSMCTDLELLSDLLDAGVYGIISKADEPEELIKAIISISEGRIYKSGLFTEAMYWSKQKDVKRHPDMHAVLLTDREKVILQLLWEEKSNKEIANHLFLSIRSVEKIRQDIKEKLGVKTTVGLIKYAIRNKIIEYPSIINTNNVIQTVRLGARIA
jgi:DNA-binding NarL/FixJ family response regulator